MWHPCIPPIAPRLLDGDNVNVWYDHAAFKARSEDPTAAITSLREALAIDPAHSPSLAAMALLSLQQYIDRCTPAQESNTESTELLENALVAGFALVDLSEGSAMSWALLALIYANGRFWFMIRQVATALFISQQGCLPTGLHSLEPSWVLGHCC